MKSDFYAKYPSIFLVHRSPITPRKIPSHAMIKFTRDRIKTVSAEWSTSHNAEKPHPAATPQAMTGNCLIGIFRTGWHVTARIAYERRQGQLVKPHKACAKQPTGRPAPRIGEITAVRWLFACGLCRMIFAAGTHFCLRRLWLFLRSGEYNPPPHQRSKAWKRDVRDSLARVQNISGPQSGLAVPGHYL